MNKLHQSLQSIRKNTETQGDKKRGFIVHFVGGGFVAMSAAELASFKAFNTRCIAELHVSFEPMDQRSFNMLIGMVLRDMREAK